MVGRKKRKNNKNKRYRIYLVVFIVGYLIFRSIPIFHASTLKTTLVEAGSLEDTIEGKGIVVKNETTYRAKGEGEISFFKEEGDRVGVGTKIGQLSSLSDKSVLKDELNDIEKKIESLKTLNGNDNIEDFKIEQYQDGLDNLINDLQTRIFQEEYDEASPLMDELYIQSRKYKALKGDKSLVNQSLNSLEKKKKQLEKEISDSLISYYSEEAGILSFKIDGLEEVFSARRVLDYSIKDFQNIEENIKQVKDGSNLKIGEPVYKVIDNFQWYLLIQIDDKNEIKGLEEGNRLDVKVDNGDEKLKSKIIKIEKDKDKAMMILELDSYCYDYYDKRYVNVNLIKNEYQGLKIPTQAISKRDGIDGVYVKDVSGIIKFRPIKILSKNNEWAIIDEGDTNHMIELKGSNDYKRTVRINDEILLDSSKIKEGQIVN